MRLLFILLIFIGVSPLSARDTYNLNRGWQFYFASEQSADEARYINLPHSWSSDSEPQANYLKEIYAPEEWEHKRIFLKFGGVQRSAELFVNGRYAGGHRGGSTAFTIEVTRLLKIQSNNTIVVAVNNSPQSDILPTSTEHNIEGGIYRDVEILVTPRSAISPLYYGSDGVFVTTTEATDQLVRGDVRLLLSQIEADECDIELSISDMRGSEIFSTTTTYAPTPEVEACVTVPFEIAKRAKLWSPDSPNLYNFKVTLRSASQSNIEDIVTIRSGFRVVDASAKNSIKINGNPITIKGVALYHDHPSKGGVLTPKEYNQDMALVREMGATAIRSAVYPHDGYLYDLCDEQGVVSWIDFPLHRAPFLADIAYIPTERFHQNGYDQFREIIAQNYNHPSVIMWGLFSTLSLRGDDSLPYLNDIKDIAIEMDPTRPTVALSDQNGSHNSVPDLIVWRQNIGWDRGALNDINAWSTMLHSRWGYMASGVSYGESGNIEHQSKTDVKEIRRSGYGEWFPEGRQRDFHNAYYKALDRDTLFWGVWLNSMFDFKSSRLGSGKNYSGAVTFDREGRKDIFYLYKSLWNKNEKTLHIVNRRDNILSTPKTSIYVYASDDTAAVTLHVGETTYAMHKIAPSQFVAEGVAIDGHQEVIAKQSHGKVVITDSVEFIGLFAK